MNEGRETAKALAREYADFFIRHPDILRSDLSIVEVVVRQLYAHDAQDAAMLKVVEAAASQRPECWRDVAATLVGLGEANMAVACRRLADALAALEADDATDG